MKIKMLNILHFTIRRRLARGLLRKLPRIVSDTALYAIVIYAVGCVIPTPLDRTPAETNFAPVFVAPKMMPTFGPLGPLSQSEAVNFSIYAADPNPDDALQVRLFELVGNTLTSTGLTTTLNYPQVRNPDPQIAAERFGSFAFSPCVGRTPGMHLIYAVVADRAFMSSTSAEVPGGLFDMNHWDLSCM